MDKKRKEDVYNKFKARSEREILMNKGEEMFFGKTVINVKALEWDDSNKFEDEVARVLGKFRNFTKIDIGKGMDIDKIMEVILSLLRNDLISLANLATKGEITLKSIRENKASKDDVIKIIIKSMEINYGYIKNLIALSNNLR